MAKWSASQEVMNNAIAGLFYLSIETTAICNFISFNCGYVFLSESYHCRK